MTYDEMAKMLREWMATPRVERFGQYVMNRSTEIPRDNCLIWEEKNPNTAFKLIRDQGFVTFS